MPQVAEEKPEKKPASAYILFVSDQYKEVAAANPEQKGKDVMTLLGAAWKKLSDAEKARRCRPFAVDPVPRRTGGVCSASGLR